ncbi:autotransporter outer membrane beta-barrel domain-containing protein, partial [Prochlorococcus sp. AH-716-M18]|nr:autotransporter outer membrane beta-barrel domain-containing protein [Prochlorococcus sp. AH-716-M18]
LSDNTEYYIFIDDRAFDDSASNSYAGISDKTTLSFATVGSNPTLKADVVGLAEAWTNAAIRFSNSSMNAVNRRLNWFRNNNDSEETSIQGIDISFANPLLNEVINGNTKTWRDFQTSDFAHWAKRNWSNEKMVNQSDEVIENLSDGSVNLALAEIRKQTRGVNLNPKAKSLIGNWSVWTDGQLMLGEKKKSSTASKQKSENSDISIGLDKPLGENGLFGIALTFGKENTDIGNKGSRIESDNYSFSIYSSSKYKNKFPLDAQLGLGKMQISTRRVENSSLYKGNRDANIIFGSAAIHGKSILRDKLEINPYSRIEAAHINFNKFTESGGGFALTFENQQLTRKILSFGLDLSYETPFKNWQLRPVGQFEYGLDFTNDSNVDMHYANESKNYRLKLSKESISYWKASTGLEFYKRNGFSANINYTHQQEGDNIFSNSYQFQVNWKF